MILPIKGYGSEILRKNTEKVPIPLSQQIKDLINDMFDTMYNARGIGLAAPQIGQSIQLFIMDTEQLQGTDRVNKSSEGLKTVIINPQIESFSGSCSIEEGCLSLPEIRVDIKRAERIKVKYWNANEELQEKELGNMEARVFLHEFDHLQGKLLIDYISPFKLKLLARRLEDIKQLKISTHYNIEQ